MHSCMPSRERSAVFPRNMHGPGLLAGESHSGLAPRGASVWRNVGLGQPDIDLFTDSSKSVSDLRMCGYLKGEMQSKSDAKLLREYAEHGNEFAFTEIVSRHTDLVYSAALRQVNSPDLACDVTQGVFVGLARGAQSLCGRLDEQASLAGWLCRTARNLSLNLRRDEFRRHSRENQAMKDLDSNERTGADWDQVHPILDEALSELNEADHDAVVLRYFKNHDLRTVGRALGVSDDTAQNEFRGHWKSCAIIFLGEGSPRPIPRFRSLWPLMRSKPPRQDSLPPLPPPHFLEPPSPPRQLLPPRKVLP